MGFGDKMRDAMLTWLRITPASRRQYEVSEQLDFNANAFKNALWYHGDAYELNQFYRQLDNPTESFWGSVPTPGLEIRKIHSGLPRLIVDTLANIVHSDLNDIEIANEEQAKIWEAIADENNVLNLLKKATKQTLYLGDGAFKVSFDPEVSSLPIVEWFPGDKVDIVYKRGRLKELVFKTEYDHNGKAYVLKEHYGFGSVTYELFKDGKEVGIDAIPETAGLLPVTFDKKVILGVPYIIHESERHEGRGQSIFDSKVDNFDSLDEVTSQWIQAMRAGRPTKYFPESLIPRNPNTGALQRPSAFDNQYIKVNDAMGEGAKNEITVKQPDFPSDDYAQTYMTVLDLCLQGLISPSTLGIDVKKLDNAEAQREKEKTTLYSRQTIIEGLTPTIQDLVTLAIRANDINNSRNLSEVEVEVSFGEYANPSFEAVVETLSNPNTPMSIEAKVDEMWGDSKDDEWKAAEVARIKEQTGVVTLPEPALNNNLPPKEGAPGAEKE